MGPLELTENVCFHYLSGESAVFSLDRDLYPVWEFDESVDITIQRSDSIDTEVSVGK